MIDHCQHSRTYTCKKNCTSDDCAQLRPRGTIRTFGDLADSIETQESRNRGGLQSSQLLALTSTRQDCHVNLCEPVHSYLYLCSSESTWLHVSA
jgi:hypothetical protein